MNGVKNLDSSAISELFQEIGKTKDKMLEFQYQWIERLQPIEAVYYDITSISSYGTNNDYIEWGYNRDKYLAKLARQSMTPSLSYYKFALYGHRYY